MLFTTFLYTIQRLYIEKKSTKGLVNSAYKLFYIQFNDYIENNERISKQCLQSFLYTIQQLYIENNPTKGLVNSAYILFYIQFNDYIQRNQRKEQ